jgi:threonine dehydrogenase-like Zn-dependent dehydrogenase
MSSDRARAFWIAVPGRGEIRDERLPAPSASEALVRAEYSGVSRGTEALVFHGRVPPSEHERMRAPFQAGHFPAPVKYGYASVGVVEQGPDEWIGRRVFALYPHQTRYVIPVEALHPLPDAVPSGRAVLAANLETALNGVWDAELAPGQRVSVVGAGAVGCLVAWLATRTGCLTELVDINPERRNIARALGVRFAPADQASPESDVVVHCSGSPAGLELALKLAAFEATIVEMSWFGDRLVPLPLGESFHARRLTLKSSQVGAVARAKRAHMDRRQRMQQALALLADAALDVMISGESRFEDLPDAMRRLAGAPGDTLCHRIVYV